jgi:hypothetical protein
MKKLLFFVIFLMAAMVNVNAQSTFKKGANVVNLGIGLGSYIPIEGSFEHGVVDGLIDGKNGSIGIGAYAGFYSYESWAHGVLGARGAFHYQFVDKLDTYAGLMLGFNAVMSSGASATSGLGFSAFLGGRYYIKPKLAIYSELGYGIAYLSVGVAFKF